MAETMKNIKSLIEAERKRLEDPPHNSVPVILGGEQVSIEVTKLHPTSWATLVAKHPVRPNVKADGNLGYNQWTLPADYPADRLKVDGQEIDRDTWVEIVSVLDVAHRHNVNTLMWGLNVYAAVAELAELGKAPAGRPSSSPANRGSRRAASKAASRQK